jgi:hypothetical protein
MNTTTKHCRACTVALVVGENWTAGKAAKRDYICKGCASAKDSARLADPKARERKRETDAAYRAAHRDECLAYGASYHTAHRDDPTYRAKQATRSAAYRAANREELAARQAAYYRTTPSRRSYMSEYHRKLRKECPEYFRAKHAARRAMKLQATPKWVRLQDLIDVETSRWAFAAMHGLDEHEVHLDHLIPLKTFGYIDGKRVRVASGLHCPDNLAWKTGKDNLRKGASLERALADTDEPSTFEQRAYAVRLGGRARLYHID